MLCKDCNYDKGVKLTTKGPLCKDCRQFYNVKPQKQGNKVEFKNNKVSNSFINFGRK
jgi:hypothetical protein